MNTDLESILSIVLDGLRENYNFNSTTYNLWFADLKLISLDECRATFTTPSNVRQRILSTKFYSQIKQTLTEAIGYEVEIDILSTAEEIVFEEVVGEVKDPTPEEKASADKRKEEINKFLDGGEKKGEESLVSRYTFDNFIEGESNKLVRAACFAVASNPTSSDYNPLFIYGESGLGKTHLLFAVLNMIKKGYPGLNIVYKTCEEFTNELVSAIQHSDTHSFKNRYRNADVLLVDDIQFIIRSKQAQEEFFHTFNAIYESGKQIIITSDRPPKEISHLEDRLRTRFEWGVMADLQKPDFALRTAIIRQKAESNGVSLNNELIDYIADRLHHDIRQIEGVIKKLHVLTSLTGDEVTKEIIDRAINSIDPGNIPREQLIEKIIKITCEFYGVSAEDVRSKKRNEDIVNARQACIFIIRKLTDMPYKAIGEIFNMTNHTSVGHALHKMDISIKTKKSVGAEINKIIAEVKS